MTCPVCPHSAVRVVTTLPEDLRLSSGRAHEFEQLREPAKSQTRMQAITCLGFAKLRGGDMPRSKRAKVTMASGTHSVHFRR